MSDRARAGHVFGPVPSRRLGRSLGVNTVPAKTCSYSCVYCQEGLTTTPTLERGSWYRADDVLRDVARKIAQARLADAPIDYLTFVASGEPTLDANLEREVEILRCAGIRTAIFTNASLIWRPEVRRALSRFDRVSLKVDAVDSALWRRINRPHLSLDLRRILPGIIEFSRAYEGILDTETMVVRGLNDGAEVLERTAAYLRVVRPDTAYISVPLRPPAEPWVGWPRATSLVLAATIFKRHLGRVVCLTESEGDAFDATDEFTADLLAITAVHPMPERAVRSLACRYGASWQKEVQGLLDSGELSPLRRDGETYYVHRPATETLEGPNRLSRRWHEGKRDEALS